MITLEDIQAKASDFLKAGAALYQKGYDQAGHVYTQLNSKIPESVKNGINAVASKIRTFAVSAFAFISKYSKVGFDYFSDKMAGLMNKVNIFFL